MAVGFEEEHRLIRGHSLNLAHGRVALPQNGPVGTRIESAASEHPQTAFTNFRHVADPLM